MFLVVVLLTLCIAPVCAQQLNPVGIDAGPLVEVVQPQSAAALQRERTNCDLQFRTIDGVCTNSIFKLWGSTGRAQSALSRLTSSARPSGGDLPSPRFISNALCKQTRNKFNDRNLNELLVFFGQFIDHTLTTTPGGSEKLPIPIPDDDPIFGNFSKGEFEFTRSKRGRVDLQGISGISRIFRQTNFPTGGLNIERPINSLTAALDLSAVYGADAKRARALRSNVGGKMKVSSGDLLPYNSEGFVNAPIPSAKYFFAGDHRSNEHPVLTSLHTLFVREHNNLCDELAAAFPDMDDNMLYETARKINGAQFQKITLEEWYPAIVGKPLPPYTGYKVTRNPTILHEFSTAAFRVGHTMVGNVVSRRGPGNSPLSSVSVTKMFFQSVEKMREGVEPFLRGAMQTKAQEVDLEVHDVLRNFLFTGIPEENVAFDLISLNIQRGRDHALPPFATIRRLLGLSFPTSFAAISSDINVQTALSSVYGSVDKVEAWIGMVAENHAPGSSLGPTIIALWEKQFAALRDGDYFYYENNIFSDELIDTIPRVKQLFSAQPIFKSILTRNTRITDSELPSRVFF